MYATRKAMRTITEKEETDTSPILKRTGYIIYSIHSHLQYWQISFTRFGPVCKRRLVELSDSGNGGIGV